MSIKEAAFAFRCPESFVSAFDRQDPFNPKNQVAGYVCRKKGLMGGSLFITSVNGKPVKPQLIYGTPKLSYPYKPGTTDYLPLKAHSIYISEKWNGMNVLYFHYEDDKGIQHLTAKSKGAPFLANSEFGDFFDLTQEAIKKQSVWSEFHRAWAKPGTAAVSFELCGSDEPHLVKYDFDIDLKPIFTVHENGKIKPVINNGSRLYAGVSSQEIIQLCKLHQNLDRQKNDIFRERMGKLPIRYEHDHFATEGKVLYPLDEEGFVIGRFLYKIKSSDVEQVHSARFDDNMERLVDEAYTKLVMREELFTWKNLQNELDFGPKQWSKWQKSIIKFCTTKGWILK